MEPFAIKRTIKLPVPDASDTRADRERILVHINDEHVHMTLRALQRLYPALSEGDYRETLAL